MATANEVIKRLIWQFTSEGADKVAGDMAKVTAAQTSTEKASVSLDKSFNNLERRFNSTLRSQQDYEKVQRQVNAAVAQNPLLQERANQVLAKAAEHFGQASGVGYAFKNALSGVQGQLIALSAGAGPAGVFLSSLGPWGTAAAIGIGAAVGALARIRDAALEVGDKARMIRDFAESTGFTITQLKALQKAGENVGVASETTAEFLERFSVNFEKLKRGSGELYDELVRINPALVAQMQTARGAADAYNLWAKAIGEATTQEQRNLLARAAGGRGGIPNARTAAVVAGAGGVDNLSGAPQTAAEVQRWAELRTEIARIDHEASGIWSKIFTTEALEAELQFSRGLKEIAATAASFKLNGDWREFLKIIDATVLGLPGQYNKALLPSNLLGGGSPTTQITVPAKYTPQGPPLSGQGAVTDADLSPEALAAKLRTQMSILGSAATSAEQLRLKQAELNAEVEKTGNQYGNLAKRAMDAYRVQLAGADLQIKIQAGAASQTEITAQKMAELSQLVRQGKLSWDDIAKGAEGYSKQIEQIVQQQEAFKSALPGLKALELEFANTRTQLDQFGTATVNNIVTGLADITTGTKNARDGFRDLGLAVLRSIEEMVIKMTIAVPIARGLQSALGGFLPAAALPIPGLTGSANGNVFDGGRLMPFAKGGVISSPMVFPFANGIGLAGEAGPEAIMPLKRHSSGRLGIEGGGVKVNVMITNKNGSNVDVGQPQRNSDGSIDLPIIIDKLVAGMMTQTGSQTSKALKALGVSKPAAIR